MKNSLAGSRQVEPECESADRMGDKMEEVVNGETMSQFLVKSNSIC